jgi:hypothetical protein
MTISGRLRLFPSSVNRALLKPVSHSFTASRLLIEFSLFMVPVFICGVP